MKYAIEFNHAWKKFKKGEKFDSLRDAVPNFFKNIIKPKKSTEDLTDREFWAVRDVDFQVKKGEVVGIIGPNGAGKSTILKMLSGILIPNKGDMKIHGRLSALIEVTAGFHPELTGRENVYLNGTILGMKKKELDAKFEDIVEFSGIREFIDTPVKRYSSGMYSRLGFSVAAHVNPDVLLVDEVLAVGDISFQAKCAQKMREMLKSGVTIAIVSHSLPLIQSLCERVILIDKGQVLKEGSPEEVIPFYEKIVFNQQEEELKNKLKKSTFKVAPTDNKPLITINKVDIIDGKGESKDDFPFGSNLTINVEYNADKKIEKPVFSLVLFRSDGVVCFESDTKRRGVSVESIEGKGKYIAQLGELKLSPGIYILQLSILDRDLVHPYVIRKEDVFKIETDSVHKQTSSVFWKDVEWRMN